MSERHWYQDGGLVFWIVVGIGVVIAFVNNSYEQARIDAIPLIVPRIVGHVEQPLLDPTTLVVQVWHEHTGVIRNGRLTVEVIGGTVETKDVQNPQSFGFEVWEPNRDKSVSFRFPLKQFDNQHGIPLNIKLIGHEIKPSSMAQVLKFRE